VGPHLHRACRPSEGRLTDNVAEHLPDKDKAWVEAKLVKAFGHPDPDQGLRNAKQLATQLDKRYPGASASLREGLQEMFTVARLGIDGRLAKTLTTSNPVESMISIARTTNRNVTRWRDGQMVLRWTAAGMLNAERSFRRIKGYKQMPQLVNALRRHTQPSATPNLSVPPPRIHHGSSPKFHETRDMLILPIGKRYRHACPFTSHCVGMFHNLQCNQSRVRSSERRRAATPTTSPDDQTAR